MALRGEVGWQAGHQKAFGKVRWKELVKALKGGANHVALVNAFLPVEARVQICEEKGLREHRTIPLVFEPTAGDAGDVVATAESDANDGLVLPWGTLAEGNVSDKLPLYFLDGASVLAALTLDPQPGHAVLDLCAAPGGKALVLASLLFAKTWQQQQQQPVPAAPAVEQSEEKRRSGSYSTLVCNEPSRGRAQRLQRVLTSFLPAELMAPAGGTIFTTTAEASASSSGGRPPPAIGRLGPFDRILVDAPCTSDGHLARQGTAALSRWATGTVKANAERQLEILQCAATLLKPGGRILYCTCALAEQENDGVIAKFLKKAPADFEVEALLLGRERGGSREQQEEQREQEEEGSLPAAVEAAVAGEEQADASLAAPGHLPPTAEATKLGVILLPDKSGYGPLYMAGIRRRV